MMTSPRGLGPIAITLLTLLPFAVGGACATGVTVGSGGAGGDSTGSSSSSGGEDAGEPDGPPGPCTMAIDCAALNDACNVGTCVNGTCVKGPANELGSCDDGQFCTVNEACVSGVCTGGTPKVCAPSDVCHIAVCDEATDACTEMPGNDGGPCDDGDACTLLGSCQSGTCSKGPPVDCSVFNGTCAIGVCDPQLGCQPMPQNDGTPCDDKLYCTINDTCQAGKCAGAPNPCAPPNNNCQVGVCNENLKSCTITVAPNGTACDDGSLCTTNETCSNGMCVNGQPANNGAACDDKNGCTMGTTCSNAVCGNPQSQINMCTSGDSCCPANCNFAQDSDCLYWQSGVQQNVPNSALVGWTQCWIGTYVQSSPALTTLLASTCNKAKLLTACRPVGAQSWTLLAMAPRADVLFDCAQTMSCVHQANGVGWYYSNTYSMGFAQGGDPVYRFSCDYNDPVQNLPNQPLRMCWHTGGGSISSGYRCGANDLNGSSTWERAIFHAD